MSPLARALIGVALGSCLTLFIHPNSRPYMFGLVPRPAEAAAIREMSGEGTGPIAAPGSTAEAGLWMQLGCARLTSSQKLSAEELDSLVTLARHMQKWPSPNQFDNAFWLQMEAVFLEQQGQTAESHRAWKQAAKCTVWRDYQAARLLAEAEQVRPRLAWHIAGVYYERRFAVGEAILGYTQRMMDKTGQKEKADLELRYATLSNAQLIAVGARSVEILKYAGEIADLAVRAPRAPIFESQALRDKARGEFYASLNALGLTEEARNARRANDTLDSQPALTREFRPEQAAAMVATRSLVTATLPDSLLLVTLVGAIIWGLGICAVRYSHDHPAFTWIAALIFGGVLGASALWLALPPLAALLAVVCALFLVFSPKNERSRLPSELGAGFNWTVGFLTILFVFAVVAYLAAASTPAKLLLPSILGASPQGLGHRLAAVLIGLAAIIFALILLAAPMWAHFRRVRTPFVLGLVFKTFGAVMVIVGLGGTVLLSPVCVYADSTARQTLEELVGNEPLHYYNQFS